MDISTPRGFRDVLPVEATEREALASAMSSAISRWGYGPVETPVVESEAALRAGARRPHGESPFRLVDSDGALLALRPDMTMPVARLVATRLKGDPGPHRLRYVADVFREDASMRGEPREFTQVGLELIGVPGPEGDAEVVAALVDALRAAGLSEFTVTLGTVAVLRSVIEAASMPEDWAEEVLAAAHVRNVVGLATLADAPGVSAVAGTALRAVPRIRGGREAIEECRGVAEPCGAGPALDLLERVWDLLEAAGAAESVTVDFGVTRSFEYYSGVVFEAYAPGVGLPLGGGGRYDDLLGEFGSPAPAAGFAVGLERVHLAARMVGATVPATGAEAVVGGEAEEAFAGARRLRARGLRVELAAGADQARVLARAASLGAVAYMGDAEVALDACS